MGDGFQDLPFVSCYVGGDIVTQEMNNKVKCDFYLAGPMTGYKELNKYMFGLVSTLLRERKYTVWSPSEYDDEHPADSLTKRMTIDLNVVINQCDRVALLPGWRESLGANAEVFAAFVCGKEVVEVTIYDGKIDDLVPVNLDEYSLPYQLKD